MADKRVLILVLVAALSSFSSYAEERYAVLVGVGEYHFLDKKYQLKGPPNDVRLARDYLIHNEGFRPDNIYWIADDAPVRPVRNSILSALQDLDKKVRRGDFVLVHLSGHGSRQPARAGDPDERDGYDEIFLPADADKWDDDIGSVQNAITDNEIGQFISSVRGKGADVWVIIDSCHSGTMTRGAGDDLVVERYVDPLLVLGIPESAAGGHRAGLGDEREGGQSSAPAGPVFVDEFQGGERGMLIAFSASHSSETAPEMPLDTGLDEPVEEYRGLLSHHIYQSLSRFPMLSYRQLAQLVTDRYASMPWRRSTPQFHGTDMDRVVFNRSEQRARLFSASREGDSTRLQVSAGTLAGFAIGAQVAFHSDSRDVAENLIGQGTVVAATATESVVEAQWSADADVPHHSRSVYVRLTAPGYSSQVVISLLGGKSRADNNRLWKLVAAVAPDVQMVEFDNYLTNADFYAAYFEERFWLLRPGQSLPCAHRFEVTTDAELAACLDQRPPEELLWALDDERNVSSLVLKAARARMLTKLQEVIGVPIDLAIDVMIHRTSDTEARSFRDHPLPLHPGDVVSYRFENTGTTAWDVFFFYVDSKFGISSVSPSGQSARILPGEIGEKKIGTISAETVGDESLVVIADPVLEVGDAVEADYSFPRSTQASGSRRERRREVYLNGPMGSLG